ncbi:MAG: acyl-ACP--UDP-N-acetylglucosamine O-acyltransferase [Planctomycetes bacterium]|nr:acyl-ACP--UDP-N-acetylglucosamine O-acyltransferase [Planctomycetota bacterium]
MPRPARAHPTAIISDDAQLPDDTVVGPFALVEGPVRCGPGCVIGPGAHVLGAVTMGANNVLHSGVVLGGTPQHLGYKGGDTRVEIGDGNTFREHATVHRGMPVGTANADGATRIGNRGYFMVGSHVAHDCTVGDDVILANSALLAGHIVLGDRVFLSGNTAVHQFVHIGRGAMLGGGAVATQDVPPFWMIQNVNGVRGLNVLGMKRSGVGPADRAAARKAFRTIYYTRPALPMSESLARVEAELGGSPLVREIVAFIRGSKRGVGGPSKFREGSEDELSTAA